MLNLFYPMAMAAALGLGIYAMPGGSEARTPAPVPESTLIAMQTQATSEETAPLTVLPSDFDSAHIEWCLEHYRSYNPRDNTFMSYSGRVRECDSPFW